MLLDLFKIIFEKSSKKEAVLLIKYGILSFNKK
jgi:hypothetical protein